MLTRSEEKRERERERERDQKRIRIDHQAVKIIKVASCCFFLKN